MNKDNNNAGGKNEIDENDSKKKRSMVFFGQDKLKLVQAITMHVFDVICDDLDSTDMTHREKILATYLVVQDCVKMTSIGMKACGIELVDIIEKEKKI